MQGKAALGGVHQRRQVLVHLVDARRLETQPLLVGVRGVLLREGQGWVGKVIRRDEVRFGGNPTIKTCSKPLVACITQNDMNAD